MTTLTVTGKGQVTLRKDLLRHLGIHPGDKIEVATLPGGRIEVVGARPKHKVADLSGMLKQEGGPCLTIDEINEAAARGWAGER